MLGVFAMHVAITLDVLGHRWEPGRKYILEAGRASLAVFFVLSGFLLYLPFALARLSGRSPPAPTAYYVRRGARIIPAYWFVLLVAALIFGWSEVFTAEGLVTYFGFLQVYRDDTIEGGLFPAWAIDVLVLFYLLLPAWAALMRRIPISARATFGRTEAGMLVALGLAGVAWKVWAYGEVEGIPGGSRPGSALLVVLPSWLDHFAMGMGLAVAYLVVSARGERRPALIGAIERRPGLAWAMAAAVFLLVVAIDPWLERGLMTDEEDPGILTAHVLCGVVAIGLLLPSVFGTSRRGLVTRLLASRALVAFGVVSYGFFLWHGPFLHELWPHIDTLGVWGFVAATLSLSLAAGALSHLLIERPVRGLGRRLPRDAARGPTAVVPVLRRLPAVAPAVLAGVAVATVAWRLAAGPAPTPPDLRLANVDGRMAILSPQGATPVVRHAVTGGIAWADVCGDTRVMRGWAIDRATGRAVDRILVFEGDRLVGEAAPGRRRGDVAPRARKPLDRSGFVVAAAGSTRAGRRAVGRLRVFALSSGRASELELPAGLAAPSRRGSTTLAPGAHGVTIRTPSGAARVGEGGLRGAVDHLVAWGPSLVVTGWAADTRRRRLPNCVLVFAGRRLLAAGPPTVRRPDLALIYSSAIEYAGFQFGVPMADERAKRLASSGHVRVFAVAGHRASLIAGRPAS